MSEWNNLPANDPDLLLAKNYGNRINFQDEQLLVEEPLLKLLYRLRTDSTQSEENIIVRNKDLSWNFIQHEIQSSLRTKSVKITSIHNPQTRFWLVAAIIIITLTSLFVIQRSMINGMELIASAGDNVSEIILTDGSKVLLRPGSELFLIDVTENQHIYSINGEALFEVEKNLERNFVVESEIGRVIVTGTKFNLRNRNRIAEIFLIDGNVIFETTDKSQSVALLPGEASIINASNQLTDPFEFDAAEIISWTENRLTFKDRTLESILIELESHFNIEIQAPDSTLQEVLGGSIQLEDVKQSLEDLGVVLNGQFVQVNESTFEFKSGQ